MGGLGHRRPGRLAFGAPASRWRVDRARVLRWAGALACGAMAAGLVLSLSGRAQDTLAGYAGNRPVAVARHDLEPGHRLSDADIDWRRLPRAALPTDAVTSSPVGEVVVAPMARGEIIGSRRLGASGLSPLAAQVGAGRRAVAIARKASGLALAPGDRVDVVAPAATDGLATSSDPGEDDSTADSTDGSAADGSVVARQAVVLAVTDDAVVVSVSRAEALAVAEALGQGQPVLTLVGAQP